jgi:hypothetical protein
MGIIQNTNTVMRVSAFLFRITSISLQRLALSFLISNVMKTIYIPTPNAESWRQFLAQPDKQWKSDHSAKELAESWERANPGLPAEVAGSLNSAADPHLTDLHLLLGIPEYKVELPGKGRPSQNDLFALCENDSGLVAIAVEGKVRESFGQALTDWLSTTNKNKKQRLEGLCAGLGLEKGHLSGYIHYQLLHRAYSAFALARTFHAETAVMMVHSFSSNYCNFKDYEAFLGLYGLQQVEHDKTYFLTNLNDVALYAGWAHGEPSS